MKINKNYFLVIAVGVMTFSLGLFDMAFAQQGLADSPWPVFHGNSRLTGLSPYDTSKIDGTVKWKFKAEGSVETSPVIDKNGNIYFIDHKCNLYAIKPDGTQRWKFNTGTPVTSKEWGGEACSQSTPAIAADGTIYILNMNGYFHAVSSEGQEKWRQEVFTFKNSWSSPAIASDGTVYISSEMYPPSETGKPEEKPGYVYAFTIDGKKKWEFGVGGAAGSTSVASIAADGTVYISSNDLNLSGNGRVNTVFALNPSDGSVKWKFPVEGGVVEGSIAIGEDETLYFSAKGEKDPRSAKFYALNSDGTLKWQFPLANGASITPAIDKGGNIYFGDWGGIFYALDKNGKELWRVDTPKGKETYESLSSSPALGSDGTIYFGTIADAFFAYSKEGKLKWQIAVPEGGLASSPAIGADGTVYFTSVKGTLYAVGSGSKALGQITSVGKNDVFPLKYILGFAGLLLLATSIIYFARKRNRILLILVGAVSLGLLVASTLLFLENKPKDQNKEKNSSEVQNLQGYACPSGLYSRGGDNYYAVYEDKSQKDLKSREVEWIKQNCPNTKLPNNSNQPSAVSPTSTAAQSKNGDCPRRVYGSDETGYYGIYEMKQRDLTNEEYNWARSNCPDVIWPEDGLGGYKGN